MSEYPTWAALMTELQRYDERHVVLATTALVVMAFLITGAIKGMFK